MWQALARFINGFRSPLHTLNLEKIHKYFDLAVEISERQLKNTSTTDKRKEKSKESTDAFFHKHLGNSPSLIKSSIDVDTAALALKFAENRGNVEIVQVADINIEGLGSFSALGFDPKHSCFIFENGCLRDAKTIKIDGDVFLYEFPVAVKVTADEVGTLLFVLCYGGNEVYYSIAISKDRNDIEEIKRWEEVFIKSISPYTGKLLQVNAHSSVNIISKSSSDSWNNLVPNEVLKSEFDICLDLIKRDHVYLEQGVTPKRGLILSGPPGAGKTLHIKSFVKDCMEAGATIFFVTGSTDERLINFVYDTAAFYSPSVVIFEDIDTIAMNRRAMFATNNSYAQSTLNALLHKLDGITQKNCITVATTNIIDALDPALSCRPGRFDRHFKFSYPSKEERLAIMEFYVDKFNLEIDIRKIFGNNPEVEWFLSKDGVTAAFCKDAVESVKRESIWANGTSKEGIFISTIGKLKGMLNTEKYTGVDDEQDLGFAI